LETRLPVFKTAPYHVVKLTNGAFTVAGPQLASANPYQFETNLLAVHAAAYDMNFGYNVAMGNVVLRSRIWFTTTVEIMHNGEPIEQEVKVVADRYKLKNETKYNYSIEVYTQDGKIVDELEGPEMQELLEQVQAQFIEQGDKVVEVYSVTENGDDS